MIYLGCHLSAAKGYLAMGKEAQRIGANTFAFFTRNPRGGKSKALDLEDIEAFKAHWAEIKGGPLVAHAPYTMNPCSATKKTRDFAFLAMAEDLERMEYLPDNYYNFHPGSHTGQGWEKGVELIAELLNETLRPEQKTIVLLETMAGKGTEVGADFSQIARIIQKVRLKEKIGVCMDSCHVSDGGYPLAEDLEGVVQEFDRIIGLDYLKALHLNDSKNPRGAHKDRHEKIGQGYLGQQTFEKIVNHPVLSRLPMILETPHENNEGYAREIQLLRALEKER